MATKDEGWATGEAFHNVQEWIETHWAPERETAPPGGAVVVDSYTSTPRPQLDARSAARRLILATACYQPVDVLIRAATEFSRHGLIEVHDTYLLSGPPIQRRISVDGYCELLPYAEAMQERVIDSPTRDYWPPEGVDACAVRFRVFEHKGNDGTTTVHSSPLLQLGSEALGYLLGLVWGRGFRAFGNARGSHQWVFAASPHRWEGPGGHGIQFISFSQGRMEPWTRPLPAAELSRLAGQYMNLPQQTKKLVTLAMRRLNGGALRFDTEDRVIDLCIALEALFMEENEWGHQRELVSRRASWYYADSMQERDRAREMLKRFHCTRSRIVHGREFDSNPLTQHGDETLAETEDVLRACLKNMISNGRPTSWKASKDCASIWHAPPRLDSDIPSAKSDSLSWSVADQKKIDRSLRSVWRSSVNKAERRKRKVYSVGGEIEGVRPSKVRHYREQGYGIVIVHPALLYRAHPKWPKTHDDELGERARYYCYEDVDRHLKMWAAEAHERGDLVIFRVGNDKTFYHPCHQHQWPAPLYPYSEA